MNNKSFYAILAFVALVGMLDLPHVATQVVRILLCGGSGYYVYSRYRSSRRITVMLILMALLFIATNPLVPIPLPHPVFYLPIYLTAGVLFWFASKQESVAPPTPPHRESEEDSPTGPR